jgi:hypothetical protein
MDVAAFPTPLSLLTTMSGPTFFLVVRPRILAVPERRFTPP